MYDIVGKNIVSVMLKDIIYNEEFSRLNINEDNIKGLSLSIKNNGFLQPLLLKKVSDKYEIILGLRRYKAAKLLNLITIPAIIIEENDKINFIENSLMEKLLIKELSPIDEARIIKNLQNTCNYNSEEINSYINKNDNYINNKLNLLNLSKECQKALENNYISEGHAKVLLKVRESDVQNRLLDKIINERLTVKETDDYIIANKLNSSLNENNNIGSYLGNVDVVNLQELGNEEMKLVNIPNKKEKNKEVKKMDMNTLNQASQNNLAMNNGIGDNANNFFPSVDMPVNNNIGNINNEMPLNMNNQINNPFIDNPQFNTQNSNPVQNDMMTNPINNSFSTPMQSVSNDFRIETPVMSTENSVPPVASNFESNATMPSSSVNMDNALICMRGIVTILQNMGYNVSSKENELNGMLEFVIEIQK